MIQVFPYYYPHRDCLALRMIDVNEKDPSKSRSICLDLAGKDSADRAYEVFSQGYRLLTDGIEPDEHWPALEDFTGAVSWLTYLPTNNL